MGDTNPTECIPCREAAARAANGEVTLPDGRRFRTLVMPEDVVRPAGYAPRFGDCGPFATHWKKE